MHQCKVHDCAEARDCQYLSCDGMIRVASSMRLRTARCSARCLHVLSCSSFNWLISAACCSWECRLTMAVWR